MVIIRTNTFIRCNHLDSHGHFKHISFEIFSYSCQILNHFLDQCSVCVCALVCISSSAGDRSKRLVQKKFFRVDAMWQRSCSRFKQRISWIHNLHLSQLSHKDASVHPFEDYIWLGDHFYRGKTEAVYQKDKSNAVVETNMDKRNMHVRMLCKIRHVDRCHFLYLSVLRGNFICTCINWRCFLKLTWTLLNSCWDFDVVIVLFYKYYYYKYYYCYDLVLWIKLTGFNL